LNGATCFDKVYAYTCVCARGYTGYNCEIDVDDCVSSPCMNGSTCTDSPGAYACTCAAGFSGASCAAEVDACSSKENDCDKEHSECVHVGVKKHECVCNADTRPVMEESPVRTLLNVPHRHVKTVPRVLTANARCGLRCAVVVYMCHWLGW